ncbi:MAG: hypothetical protein MH252_03575 [Thermosynechococcaceae cyanobacterium MS004]|nr:hypothetical protein [Thermosynechococcaceae cyanobacterium MS004]
MLTHPYKSLNVWVIFFGCTSKQNAHTLAFWLFGKAYFSVWLGGNYFFKKDVFKVRKNILLSAVFQVQSFKLPAQKTLSADAVPMAGSRALILAILGFTIQFLSLKGLQKSPPKNS